MDDGDKRRIFLAIVPSVLLAAHMVVDSWAALRDGPSFADDEDHSVELVLQTVPLIWAACMVTRRPRFAGDQLLPELGWYIKPRSTIHWWNHFVFHAHVDDERWREMFRLPYDLFKRLVDLVRHDIYQKQIPVPLRNIPGRIWSTEKKVGLAIMLLSSGNSQHHVANCFGCGRSTVSKFLHQFVAALIKNAAWLLRWPVTEGELMEVKEGFRALRGLPNCCGTIDATHVNMHLPKNETNEAWYDRYGNYSMIIQGIVDTKMRFLDVNIGWQGSCNDKRVLRNSGFHRLSQGRERLSGQPFMHEGMSIPEYIVGDGGYLLLPWLIMPYPQTMLHSASHRRFNFLQSSTRIVVERAFGRLKETWKFVGGTIRSPNLLTLPATIYACCILHNMLMDLAEEGEREVQQVDINDPLVDNPFAPDVGGDLEDSPEGIALREDLREFLDSQGLTD